MSAQNFEIPTIPLAIHTLLKGLLVSNEPSAQAPKVTESLLQPVNHPKCPLKIYTRELSVSVS